MVGQNSIRADSGQGCAIAATCNSLADMREFVRVIALLVGVVAVTCVEPADGVGRRPGRPRSGRGQPG